MFTGLSAFPLTPLRSEAVDEDAFTKLVKGLADHNVDSISVLGSTGSFAYLSAKERARVIELAIHSAQGVPVFVGVGALRTPQVLDNIATADALGADAVILTPVSYHPLTEDEVFELFRAAAEHSTLPLIVYENPNTTRFTFNPDLYQRIGNLPGIASIKLPPLPSDFAQAKETVGAVRDVIPGNITIGISGDASAIRGFRAGCDVWYSVIGGILPQLAKDLTRLAQNRHWKMATAEFDRLRPLWSLFDDAGGSVRVVAALAENLGLASPDSLPKPLRGLNAQHRARLKELTESLSLRG